MKPAVGKDNLFEMVGGYRLSLRREPVISEANINVTRDMWVVRTSAQRRFDTSNWELQYMLPKRADQHDEAAGYMRRADALKYYGVRKLELEHITAMAVAERALGLEPINK